MKLLMTTDTVGGVWTYAMELIRALDSWPCEVALATMGAPLSAAQQAEANALPNVTVYESTYRLEWMTDPWDDVAAAGRWLLTLEEALSPDLIHLNNYAHGALPWRAPLLMVGHSCVLSWWEAVKGEAAPAEWHRYAQCVRTGLRGADLVIAPSHAMLQALRHHYGPFVADRVIYNSRRAELFQPATKEPMVLTVGRLWDEAKNLQLLAAAAPKLCWPIYSAGATSEPQQTSDTSMGNDTVGSDTVGSDIPVGNDTVGNDTVGNDIPVGNGTKRRELQSLGQLTPSQVAAWMGRAAIYALPARYEPFGLSVLEAALSGCALVLGDIPSLREIWGDAACWVNPTDAQGLLAALEALSADPAARVGLGKQAYARAQRYKSATMGIAYWQLYQQVIAAHHRLPNQWQYQLQPCHTLPARQTSDA